MSTVIANNRRRRALQAKANAGANQRQLIQMAALELLSSAEIKVKLDLTDELLNKVKRCSEQHEPLILKIEGLKFDGNGKLPANIIC